MFCLHFVWTGDFVSRSLQRVTFFKSSYPHSANIPARPEKHMACTQNESLMRQRWGLSNNLSARVNMAPSPAPRSKALIITFNNFLFKIWHTMPVTAPETTGRGKARSSNACVSREFIIKTDYICSALSQNQTLIMNTIREQIEGTFDPGTAKTPTLQGSTVGRLPVAGYQLRVCVKHSITGRGARTRDL